MEFLHVLRGAADGHELMTDSLITLLSLLAQRRWSVDLMSLTMFSASLFEFYKMEFRRSPE